MHATTTVLFLATIAVRGGAQTLPAASQPNHSAGSRSASPPASAPRPQHDLIIAGALGAGVAVSMFDARLLAGTRLLGNHAEMDRGSAIGSAMGGPGPIALGAALYTAGRVTGDSFAATTGREVIRAVVVSGGLTALIKGAVGRSRPLVSPDDADGLAPGTVF